MEIYSVDFTESWEKQQKFPEVKYYPEWDVSPFREISINFMHKQYAIWTIRDNSNNAWKKMATEDIKIYTVAKNHLLQN